MAHGTVPVIAREALADRGNLPLVCHAECKRSTSVWFIGLLVYSFVVRGSWWMDHGTEPVIARGPKQSFIRMSCQLVSFGQALYDPSRHHIPLALVHIAGAHTHRDTLPHPAMHAHRLDPRGCLGGDLP